MSALEWIGVVLLVLALLLVVVLAWAVRSLARTVRDVGTGLVEVGQELDQLRRQALPLLAETRAALRRAEGENRKVDTLVETAESITGTVDAASRLAYRVLSNPVVKLLAFFTGTSRAAKRLREVTSEDGRTQRRLTRAVGSARARREAREAREAREGRDARRPRPDEPPALPPAGVDRTGTAPRRRVRGRG